jgi:hypothetical protein
MPCARICVTPTRNEAWIIGHFLAAAKMWADHVVVADQGSIDGTWETLQNRPGVHPVVNDTPGYDEGHRQRLLLNHVRQIEGKRILIGLDADEALSSNLIQSKQWAQLCDAKPGTVLRFKWVNILPGFKEAWIPPQLSAFGFVDDGSEHNGRRIHSPRVPQPPNAPVIDLEDVVVLHFQYVSWERMVSKHRWYQTWEFAKHREKGPLQIFREYHHMYGSWEKSELHPVKPEWFEGFERLGIDYRTLKSEPMTWWDQEVLHMLNDLGCEYFRKIAIWDKDWDGLAASNGTRRSNLADPRSAFEKVIHRLLAMTQGYRSNFGVRGLERILRLAGW